MSCEDYKIPILPSQEGWPGHRRKGYLSHYSHDQAQVSTFAMKHVNHGNHLLFQTTMEENFVVDNPIKCNSDFWDFFFMWEGLQCTTIGSLWNLNKKNG